MTLRVKQALVTLTSVALALPVACGEEDRDEAPSQELEGGTREAEAGASGGSNGQDASAVPDSGSAGRDASRPVNRRDASADAGSPPDVSSPARDARSDSAPGVPGDDAIAVSPPPTGECNAPIPATGTVQGDTTGALNVLHSSCASTQGSGPELVYEVFAPQDGRIELALDSTADLGLSVRHDCVAVTSELACQDLVPGGQERISLPVVSGERIFVVVEGWNAGVAGAFSLDVLFQSADEARDASSDLPADASTDQGVSDAGQGPADAGADDGSDGQAPFDLLPPITPGAPYTFLSEQRPELRLVKVKTFLQPDLPDLSTGTPTEWIVTPSDLEFFPNRTGESLFTTSTGLIVWLDRDMHLLGYFQIECANNKVRVDSGEGFQDNEGLLGLVFDPNFEDNGYFYLHAVPHTRGGIDIWRLQWNPGDLAGMWAGRELILSVEKPQLAGDLSWLVAHDAGNPSFGPDGKLYVALGDGNIGSLLPYENHPSQRDDTFWGKIIRVDPAGVLPPTIVAKGLRNPFRHTWRGTELYIGDVGSDWDYSWEEINRVDVSLGASVTPANFGWPLMPGPCALIPDTYYLYSPDLDCAGFTDAVHGYEKSSDAFFLEDPEGTVPDSGPPFRSALILGPAYSGVAYDGYLDNVIVYGDLLQNWVRGALFDRSGRLVADRHLAHIDNYTVAFDVGPDGHVYLLNGYVSESSIYRLELVP